MDGTRRLAGVRRDWEPTRRSQELMALVYERLVPVRQRPAAEPPRPAAVRAAAAGKGVPA